ncbi:osmoprotectant transport system ATP-binding protein [Symbiobacterium terraclitae]|uniref:Quaternary amine transport ATP-binding protein n=1 Tax=Symbiobacterium terraclitae TaxID=557451 RepID=A0ABS4JQZ4_9FIRM|nr:osmoprotectant transport system ATP-binding protein [Symbiobacterium terraclitae]
MVRFENVSKVYPDGTKAVQKLNLHIERGEFVCLIGPSGCGKTTTMKMINRLHEPTSGKIYVDGRDISTVNPVELRRNIGYVIQQVGLFPHLTIAQNIELVPRLLGWDRARRAARVDELLAMVGLDPATYRDRYPRELSGGQQQRVGVLRALAAEPDLILMDEPFGALDPITREALQDELKRLQAKLKKTVVFVTHDMDEALKLADRIVVMKDGLIHQVASPEELLRNPKDEFVAQFIGRDRMVASAESLTVADVMIRNPVSARPEFGLAEAVATMRKRRVNSVLVVDEDDRLLGIVTARAIERGMAQHRTLGEIMETRLTTVAPHQPVTHAVQRMLLERLEFLPVVDEMGRLQGLVTNTSLVGTLFRTERAEGVSA